MKVNEKKELHNKTYEELAKLLTDTKAEIATMKIDAKLGKVTNTSLIRTKKKDVARIMTLLTTKQPEKKDEQKEEKKKEVTKKPKKEEKTEKKSKTVKKKGDSK